MKVLFVLSSLLVATMAQDYCLCGQENIAKRILGGKEAQKGRYPWMVKVDTELGGCGGSIINDRYVLTAAHCFPSNPKAEETRITIGMHDTNDRLEAAKVEKVILHPQYRKHPKFNFHSDIALVKLAKPLKFSGSLNPVCLGSADPSKDMLLTGWGLTRLGDKLAGTNTLQEGILQYHNTTVCQGKWGDYFDGSTTFCAGNKINSCMGDSGGPISEVTGGHVYQMGVVSWGTADCNVKVTANGEGFDRVYPSVYTKVKAFKQWLGDNMPDAQWCKPGAHNLLFA